MLLPLFKTVRSSSYTFLRKKKKTTTTTKNYFRTGHEEQEFVCFSKSTPFYDTEQTWNCRSLSSRSIATKRYAIRFSLVPPDASEVFLMIFINPILNLLQQVTGVSQRTFRCPIAHLRKNDFGSSLTG